MTFSITSVIFHTCEVSMKNYYDFLRNEISSAIPSKFKTQGELADAVGTSQANISMFLSGKRGMSFDIACNVLDKLGIELKSKAEEKFYPLEIYATANTKPTWKLEQSTPINRIFVPHDLHIKVEFALQVDDESMFPTIKKGALVGIKLEKEFVSNEIYAVRMPYEGVSIKRVSIDHPSKSYIIKSDSYDQKKYPQHELSILDNPQFIIGKIAWVWQNL